MAGWIAKIARPPEVHLKSKMLDFSDPISILGLFPGLQMACDIYGVHEGAAIGFFPSPCRNGGSCPQCTHMSFQVKWRMSRQKTTVVLLCCELLTVHIHNQRYHCGSALRLLKLKQPASHIAIDYAQNLWSKAQRCVPLYYELRIKGLFMKRTKTDDLTKRLMLVSQKAFSITTVNGTVHSVFS